MTAPRPFTVQVQDHELVDLQDRLQHTRWVTDLPNANWDYGTSVSAMRNLCAYWRDGFDWRAQEARINTFPQWTLSLNDLDVHFLHARSPHANAMPLVLTHGWPDSIVRFLDIIPFLTHPLDHGGTADDAFHIVAPSIPGYGFSSAPRLGGFTSVNIADIWLQLMSTLGYERYLAHGGDIGSGITQRLAQHAPESVVGIHLTDVPYLNTVVHDLSTFDLTPEEHTYFTHMNAWRQTEGAYSMLQSTKPQSLAAGLNDSPVGLASWIVEKFHRWSSRDWLATTRDTDILLTNIMIYWVTQSIGTSFLQYYEPMHTPLPDRYKRRVDTPTGFAIFPHDLSQPPRRWAERFFNVQHWSNLPRGGHFAAMEEPLLLAQDLRSFASMLRHRYEVTRQTG